MRHAMLLFAVIAGAYALICVAAFIFQNRLVFFPARKLLATPDAVGLLYEDVLLNTSDGVRLHGWYVPPPSPKGRVVLFCHGNAGNISDRLQSLRLFHELSLGVFIFDYRGYGRSAGAPSESGTYEDARAAYDHLVVARNIEPERIILFGRSLGAAVAIALAAERPVSGLIVESAFTSLADVGQRAYPFLPVQWLLRARYNAAARAGAITCPKLFLHSPGDEVVPFKLGMRLYELAAEPKRFVEMEGDHNSGFMLSGERYVATLREFVASLDE